MRKQSSSFSIDADLAELRSQMDEKNWSAAVNNFLREFAATGRGQEAALNVRLEQLDDEISDLRKRLEQRERERDRIEEALSERREELQSMLRKAEQQVQTPGSTLEVDPANPAIQNWAAKAGVTPERFVDELEARV